MYYTETVKCPDCGGRLVELKMEGGDMAHRCGRCGGFFMSAGVINRISAKQLDLWRRISISSQWISGGKGVCPLDQSMLVRYTGDAVPKTIPAMRCPRCSKWWFPGDSLFDFKPAQEAKVSYFKWWGVTADLAGMILPVATVVLLTAGVMGGVILVRQKQQIGVPASSGVRDFRVAYQGRGKVIIWFNAEAQMTEIEFRVVSETQWSRVGVQRSGNGYEAEIYGLVEGEKYVARIGGREFEFAP